MFKYILYSFLGFTLTANAQELVQNGDFETYTSCPEPIGMIDNVAYWSNPGVIGSPDYFNTCNQSFLGVPVNAFGSQDAHSGNGYIGLCSFAQSLPGFPIFREYIQNQLDTTLVEGTCYSFEMYLSFADLLSPYFVDNIQVYFSDTLISNNADSVFQMAPQLSLSLTFDSLNWMKLSGNYMASGTENYMVIGNFFDNWQTNAVLLTDDVARRMVAMFISTMFH